MEDEHVTLALLAYLDGALGPDERQAIETHLAHCPQCASILEDLREVRSAVGLTLDAALSPLHLSRSADERIRTVLRSRIEGREGWMAALWKRRGVWVNAVLAVVTILFSLGFLKEVILPPHVAAQETLVLGQSRFSPGSQAALRVVVRSAGAALPMAGAEVAVSLMGASGAIREVYRGATGDGGTADVRFVVPEEIEGSASLIVQTRSADAENEVTAPIEIVRSYRIYLATDRPAYRPGQTVYLRALVLDSVTLKAVGGEAVTFSLHNADGVLVTQRVVQSSDFGIAHDQITLADGLDEGHYRLSATLDDTTNTREIAIAHYPPPEFRVQVSLERAFYAPGDVLRGTIEASYFFQRPVAEARVRVRAYVDGHRPSPIFELMGQTDSGGSWQVTAQIPEGIPDGTLVLEIQVVDGAGRSAGLRHVVPVSRSPLLFRAVPEGGKLQVGVENTVFLAAVRPDGSPAQAQVALEVQGLHYDLNTGEFGLASFRFVPQKGKAELVIRARDRDGPEVHATLPLPSGDAQRSLLLHTERARYSVGETVGIQVLSTLHDGEVIYLDIERAGQMIAGLVATLQDGRALYAFDLGTAEIGALTLRAYAMPMNMPLLEDVRLIVVDAADSALSVGLSADRAEYSPDETARITLTTTDSDGAAAVAALGIAVVDESSYALDVLPVGFARAYALLEREMLQRALEVPGLDPSSLLGGSGSIAAAQDLAARAAWTEVSAAPRGLDLRSVGGAHDVMAESRRALGQRIGVVVVLLPFLLLTLVARELRASAVAGQALRRVAWGGLGAILLSPLLIVGGLIGYLIPVLGATLFVGIACLAAGLLLVLWGIAWMEHSSRAQIIGGLVLTYLVLGAGLIVIAAAGVVIPGMLAWAVMAGHVVQVSALAWFGQGTIAEGRRSLGWAWTVLALLLLLLTATLPAAPHLASDLSRRLGDPALYMGPLGWLTGCAARQTPQEPLAKTEAPSAEGVAQATQAVPTAAPTATPPAISPEPYPLRQLFPETLYWMPEAVTDAEGRWVLELLMPGNITTWRVTALASTQEGAIGAATYPLLVRKAFFIDIEAPTTDVRAGEPLTLTLSVYSELPETVRVEWQVTLGQGAELLSAPEAVWVDSGRAVGAELVLRPDHPGSLKAEITAVAGQVVDRVGITLAVQR